MSYSRGGIGREAWCFFSMVTAAVADALRAGMAKTQDTAERMRE
jgi:hypothetical protein